MIFFLYSQTITMKKLLIVLSAAILVTSSCADETKPSKEGEEQVPQPVENSGANTEGQRAVEATVNDTTNTGTKKDSTD